VDGEFKRPDTSIVLAASKQATSSRIYYVRVIPTRRDQQFSLREPQFSANRTTVLHSTFFSILPHLTPLRVVPAPHSVFAEQSLHKDTLERFVTHVIPLRSEQLGALRSSVHQSDHCKLHRLQSYMYSWRLRLFAFRTGLLAFGTHFSC
jgi:hypothetical protein